MGEAPRHSPSLRDLARLAGVSVGTASQALRGVGTTSQKTRERLQSLAREVGYVPDPAMAAAGARHRAGRHGRSRMPIGFLCVSPRDYHASQPSIRFLDQARVIAEAQGHELSLEVTETLDELRQTLRQWYHRGYRGILASHIWNPDWVPEVDWSGFSVIYLGGRLYPHLFNTVSFNAMVSTDLVLREAFRRYQTVGTILHFHSEQQVADDWIREGVCREYRRQFGKRMIEPLRLPFKREMTDYLDDWIERNQPDVLIGFPVALAYAQGLWSQGREKRPFILFSGADGIAFPGLVEPEEHIVTVAFEQLESMIRRGERGVPSSPLCISVPPQSKWSD